MEEETATEKDSRNLFLPQRWLLERREMINLDRDRLHTVTFLWHTTMAYQQHSR